MEAMVADRMISREVYNWVRQELDRAWRSGIERPALSRVVLDASPLAGDRADAA